MAVPGLFVEEARLRSPHKHPANGIQEAQKSPIERIAPDYLASHAGLHLAPLSAVHLIAVTDGVLHVRRRQFPESRHRSGQALGEFFSCLTEASLYPYFRQSIQDRPVA